MKNKPIIFYDGVCNLCNTSVQFIIGNETEPYFSFASLQSSFGQSFLQKHQLSTTTFNSIIVWDNGEVYFKSNAALQILKKMKQPYRMLSMFRIVPTFIRDSAYQFIANNRYRWFGRKEICMLPDPAMKARFIP